MTQKPDAFLSYTRFDDDYYRGQITEFRVRLERTVRAATGKPFEIFQDVDDEKGIGLGQKWKVVLDGMLDRARFFIPIMTPSFFNSTSCREELNTFLRLEREARRDDLVLPIYWLNCPVLHDADLKAHDELAQALDERHRMDWRALVFKSLDSEEAHQRLTNLAAQIERAKRRPATHLASSQAAADVYQQKTDGILTTTGLQEARPSNKSSFNTVNQQSAMLARAFPMNGRTRLVYTCRSTFERPNKFKCPSKAFDEHLLDSKTIPLHIPVDEIETLAPILNSYGDEICNDQENMIKYSFICSSEFQNFLDMIDKNNIIHEYMLDNIIFIGENDCSNEFIRRFMEGFFFRNRIRVEVFGNRQEFEGSEFYKIGMQFFGDRANTLSKVDKAQILSDDSIWAMINCAVNPFSPDKKVLFLMGKHRQGQMMLLDWIRNRESEEVFNLIASDINSTRSESLQIVICGETQDGSERDFWSDGQLHRIWVCKPLRNVSSINAKPRPYFSKVPMPYGSSTPGDDIADISLIANIENENDTIKRIINTLSKDINLRCDLEDLHITLYEFMHQGGRNHHGTIDTIIEGRNNFCHSLAEKLKPLPPIKCQMRQAKFTGFSLHIYADLYFTTNIKEIDFEKVVHSAYRDKFPYMGPLDVIATVCESLAFEQDDDIRSGFNIMASPRPLHMTIARFDNSVGSQQKDLVRQWVNDQMKTVWGTLSCLPMSLVSFKEFPVGRSVQRPLRSM